MSQFDVCALIIVLLSYSYTGIAIELYILALKLRMCVNVVSFFELSYLR